ncbi:hypothetical protein GF326_00735 [Candidatus Bathyarchaeota archaeon]|nr:hypothetical protein [Candidatus Bathyarchaeota archaeon]
MFFWWVYNQIEFSVKTENLGKKRKSYNWGRRQQYRLNLKAKKSYQVAKYLLLHQVTSQTEVSQSTNVAIGYVNEVLHYLSDLDIVKIEYGKTRLQNYAKLLEKISMDRPMKKLVQKTIKLPTSTIKETENTLHHYCIRNQIQYAFTGYSALRHLYEYHINYPTVQIYTNNLTTLLNIEQGEGVVPIVILKPDRLDIMKNKTIIHDIHICDKIQVIIDLYSSGVGRDAAIKYYRATIWKQETY